MTFKKFHRTSFYVLPKIIFVTIKYCAIIVVKISIRKKIKEISSKKKEKRKKTLYI